MKLSTWIGIAVGLFCLVCIVEAGTWPVKAPRDWHPAWWQIYWMVPIGYVLSLPLILAVVTMNRVGITNEYILEVIGYGVQLITIVGVFYLTRYLVDSCVSTFGKKWRT
ncbi:MAG: hypothetical protein QM715_01215 [Nibricoccus sp.]